MEEDLIRHGQLMASAIVFTPSGFSTETFEPTDLRFDRPASGLYWQVSRGDDVQRSRSLWDNALALPAGIDGSGWHRGTASGPFGQQLVHIARTLQPDETTPPVTLILAADRQNLIDARDEFSRELAIFLSLLWATLSLAAWLQVKIGLLPLRAVQSSIAGLKSSPASRLDTARFATEVTPLVDQINALAEARETDLTAAQERAANLAHGLKTPLAALKALARRVRAAGEADTADGLEQSITAASEAVERELARARTAASRDRGPVDPRPLLDRLAAVLSRTERGANIDIRITVAPGTKLPVSADQLMEMAGPLMENATRYAGSLVQITSHHHELLIEDDGPGLGSADRQQVLLRGQRADERPGGHGLGLSIAHDLAEATGATLSLETSSLGGLCAHIRWRADQ